MKHLLAQLGEHGAFDQVVLAGAGHGAALPALRALKPRTLLLVEAGAAQSAELERKLDPARGERLLMAALSDRSGQAALHRFSNEQKNSLLPASELLVRFPNLRALDPLPVACVVLAEVLAPLALVPALRNLLILDIGGMEQAVLGAAAPALLQQLSHILIASSTSPLYLGAGHQASLDALLGGAGFALLARTSSHLPPYVDLLYQRQDGMPASERELAAAQASPDAAREQSSNDQADALPAPPCLIRHALGSGWGANTINTVIFRHQGVFTVGRFQFSAFYVDGATLRLARRDLDTEELSCHDLPGRYHLHDAHNSISMGADRLGNLHLCYGHHNSALRYRRSLAPLAIEQWSEELPMTGQYEDSVSYPSFLMGGQQLMLLYRDGSWKCGDARLKVYDDTCATWSDRALPILSGARQRPWTSSAYWNHPVFGADNCLHLSFVWRTHALGAEGRINNINIGYARSRDQGVSWETSRGRPYRLPITQVNGETVVAVSPGSNLINQCSMAVDRRGRPHIVFYADDADAVPQYQHAWFDGATWRHQVVSRRSEAFSLLGGGTLCLPVSRPEALIDDEDNLHLIFRGDLSGQKMAALTLAAPAYDPATARLQLLWDEPLGHAEPVVDRLRWQRDKVLSMLIQHNLQPDGDLAHAAWNTPVYLADVHLSTVPLPRASDT